MHNDEMFIEQISASDIERYSEIPISFKVEKILQVSEVNRGLGGIELIEQECTPFVKNYDLYEHPLTWSKKFDLNSWGLFVVVKNKKYVGGAAVAPQISDIKNNMAVLWDLRVHPEFRYKGIGGRLLKVVKEWARERNYATLMVETQNINLPACKFYSRKGFYLGTIDKFGYSISQEENETKLLWYKSL